MAQSKYLAGLDAEQRAKLEQKLLSRQSGRCFICDDPIDLVLHKGQLDIDHIDPLAEQGLDAENNFAITHASCNRSKERQTSRLLAGSLNLSDSRSRRRKPEGAGPTLAMYWRGTAARRLCSGFDGPQHTSSSAFRK